MFIRKIGKRLYTKMISQFNLNPKILSLSSIQKPQNYPLSSSLKVQSFSSSSNLSLNESSTGQSSISLTVNRMSRLVRTDAQSALFDYLHCTRGFSFTDAEHISKNSPHFLQILLSKVNNEQNVSKLLSKYFRYNPINEFEPFFESLGLTKSEITPLLPRDLMFLNDDTILLDNFHVLCDYGFPRTKIGKIYKEDPEIFKSGFDILSKKLKAYEDLGLSKPSVIKLITCCPSILIGEVNKPFIEVFNKLRELGFESDWIGDYTSSKNTCNWNKVYETMCFLFEAGYNNNDLQIMINTNPDLLFEGSGKQIYILITRLLKLGLTMKKSHSLISENPDILSRKCLKKLLNSLYFLYEIGMETDTISKIVLNHIKLLCTRSLKGPNTILKVFKGDKEKLREIIRNDYMKLFELASKLRVKNVEIVTLQDQGKLSEKTSFLLRLGYLENSDELAKALKKFRGRGDQLQERFNCLVESGLDFNVVSNMIRQAPTVLNQSKDVLEKKIECLKKLKYPIESIEQFPSYLCYDIERINLRFGMYDWLRKKGGAKPMLSVSTLLACSDVRFVKYFVDVHPDGPVMWERLKKSSF